MKIVPSLLVSSILIFILSACDTNPLLRDDYMGKKVVEPRLLPQPVARDGNGNPMLRPKSSIWLGFLPSLR